jgi:hypothetical protein
LILIIYLFFGSTGRPPTRYRYSYTPLRYRDSTVGLETTSVRCESPSHAMIRSPIDLPDFTTRTEPTDVGVEHATLTSEVSSSRQVRCISDLGVATRSHVPCRHHGRHQLVGMCLKATRAVISLLGSFDQRTNKRIWNLVSQERSQLPARGARPATARLRRSGPQALLAHHRGALCADRSFCTTGPCVSHCTLTLGWCCLRCSPNPRPLGSNMLASGVFS